MIKILKNLKDYKLSVLFIILLLMLQAYCDLTLPQFTSDIVDVGIQQGGIENTTFLKVREKTLLDLELFMSQEEIDTINQYYTKNENNEYTLNTKDESAIEKISTIFGVPIVLTTSLDQSGQMSVSMIKDMLASEQITKEQILQIREQALQDMGDMNASMITQKAVSFVGSEYQAMGMDLGKIQIQYLLKKGIQMLILTIIMVGGAIVVGYLASRVGAGIGRNLRKRVFGKVVSFSNAEIDHFSTASLITRSTNDIQQVQMVTIMLLRMVVYAPIMGAGGVIKVAGTSTGMSWIVVLAVAVVISVVAILVSVTMPKFKKMQTLVDNLNLVSREILTGIPVIRAFSRERFEEKRFDQANTELMKTQLFTNKVMSLMFPLMTFIMNAVSVLIVWVGAKHIDMGTLQVGDMIAFITYTMQIIMSFLILSMISIMLPRAGVAAQRIDEVIHMNVTIHDPENNQDEKLAQVKGVLSFEHVNFRYPNAKEDVLNDLTFSANPGETTAIIGSTGCGKSTLLHLIPRFYDVTAGKITIDGVNIRDISQKKLHSLLGFVPQKGVLFSGDIESNIKFGNKDIADDVMIEAAQIAQASEFIEEKNEKYGSEISQGGTNVSGGQKQRLSIARAIAINPKIYLFDDSFSALDYQTDVALRKALNKKTEDATVIIVAQRISTILHADKIIVLDDGKIVGMGTHEELLKSCEAYEEIAKSQLSEAELQGGKKA